MLGASTYMHLHAVKSRVVNRLLSWLRNLLTSWSVAFKALRVTPKLWDFRTVDLELCDTRTEWLNGLVTPMTSFW